MAVPTTSTATHKASYQVNASRVGPSAGGWTELTSSQYNKIETSNNVNFVVDGSITNDEYALVLCRFKPAEAAADMTKIKGVARGYGQYLYEDTEEVYGFYLYIRNTNSSAWELLASHTNDGNQTISGSKTSSLTNYVDGSGFVYLLVSSPACEDEGKLDVDYVACEITYIADKCGVELYIHNFNSSSWELLSSHENSSDTSISGSKTSSISNYLDGSDYVMLLAYQKYETPAGKTGRAYTDYAECEITYVSSSNNTYTYDVNLKRIKKDVDGTVTKFVYDNWDCVAEYDGQNNLQASYITPALDKNLSIKRSGSTYYYHQDALGSIRNITDSSEVAQNTYDYYAFGSVVGTPTENVTNDYRFTGRRWDSESSLYYYRARMYAPTIGRFTTRDPLGPETAMNLYLYVLNNPGNLIDPQGLWHTMLYFGHAYLTEGPMRNKRFPKYCIRKAVNANLAMDRSVIRTGSRHGRGNWTKYALKKLNKAVELWKKCKKSKKKKACKELGKGLHTTQDSTAHQGPRYRTWYEDEPYIDKHGRRVKGAEFCQEFKIAESRTDIYLRRFIIRIQGSKCGDDDDGDDDDGDGGLVGGGPTGDWQWPWGVCPYGTFIDFDD